MVNLNSSSRLKIKRDTFILPEPNGGVYLRNNAGTFRMEGKTIYQWMEKLIPLFNGERTMEELTEGLTVPYRDRVYEIGETLYKNGYVNDLSKDKPHQLNPIALEKYASQIEFIDSFMESAAYRFQQFREAKVLVIGSGSIVVSMVSSLIETGLVKIHVMISDDIPVDRSRLNELMSDTGKTDKEFEVIELPLPKKKGSGFWKEAVCKFDWVMYASQDGNIQELRELNKVCKEEKKSFLPAVCFEHMGLAGPLVHPDLYTCWESAWRRIHQTVLQRDIKSQTLSLPAGAILSNVAVFELFKRITGVAGPNQSNQIYILDLETLEGDWFMFFTHPLVTEKGITYQPVSNLDVRLQEDAKRNSDANVLLYYFSSLTSEVTGIFHLWEEKNLSQLPLSQCYVQAVNPQSEGPAELLPKQIVSGLTHEEAKREAGLTGIEMYVSKMIHSPIPRSISDMTCEFLGVGTGETVAEAILRGLQNYLEELLKNRGGGLQESSMQLQLGTIKDRYCQFYLNALEIPNMEPTFGRAEDIMGFPVIWVNLKGRRYNGTGLNLTLAIRNSLRQAVSEMQNQNLSNESQEIVSSLTVNSKESKCDAISIDEISHSELLKSAISLLDQNNIELLVYDLSCESFLKDVLAGVYGVQLRKGVS